MSSFNINGPSSNQPLVQGSQNLGKDGGGGGNTGYMNMRGKKKKSSSKNEEDNSVFLEEEIEDTFTKQGSLKEKKQNKFAGIISKFIKEKDPPKSEQDFFEKQENTPSDETDENAEEENFSEYQAPVNYSKDPLEDDEYEIVDGDDYYNGIDV